MSGVCTLLVLDLEQPQHGHIRVFENAIFIEHGVDSVLSSGEIEPADEQEGAVPLLAAQCTFAGIRSSIDAPSAIPSLADRMERPSKLNLNIPQIDLRSSMEEKDVPVFGMGGYMWVQIGIATMLNALPEMVYSEPAPPSSSHSALEKQVTFVFPQSTLSTPSASSQRCHAALSAFDSAVSFNCRWKSHAAASLRARCFSSRFRLKCLRNAITTPTASAVQKGTRNHSLYGSRKSMLERDEE
eukprot:CAMPEP_0119538878 /NCGR_PEP_ID=MMETSP1344-20130328/51186_1 /TAXON_ID=236787 /ORGANISM="Florenciella parvula, Strain CCMP2471" /LENGTH=241 /DNA_ID=CAMNT_0007581959 /DNA_START=206 /DNA_END=933 /DNA_ORIENTATION=+